MVDAPARENVFRNGRGVRVPPAPALERESSYLEHLPGIFREDGFMRRFLLIFEDTLGPIEQMVTDLAYYFDPATAPATFLPWLAGWVAMSLDERLSEPQQRALLSNAAELFRKRGTVPGLKRVLAIVSGVEPLIVENTSGFYLSGETRLGLNMRLGRNQPFTVTITLAVDRPARVDRDLIEEFIKEYKPAHVTHMLHIVPRPGRR